MPGTDSRYGRTVAGILRAIETGSTTPEDAERLRRELDAWRVSLEQERHDRRQRIRAGLGLARGTLANLIHHEARPVHGGALVVIDGGRKA